VEVYKEENKPPVMSSGVLNIFFLENKVYVAHTALNTDFLHYIIHMSLYYISKILFIYIYIIVHNILSFSAILSFHIFLRLFINNNVHPCLHIFSDNSISLG
jgi:hypothetical protein